MPLPYLDATGRLTADPELRYTQNGIPVAGFTVACNERTLDRESNEWKDAGVTFVRCVAWRDLGEHVAASLRKGDEVRVTGKYVVRDFEDKEGNQRQAHELLASDVSASLRRATATIAPVRRETSREEPADPWGSTAAAERPVAASGRRAAPVAA